MKKSPTAVPAYKHPATPAFFFAPAPNAATTAAPLATNPPFFQPLNQPPSLTHVAQPVIQRQLDAQSVEQLRAHLLRLHPELKQPILGRVLAILTNKYDTYDAAEANVVSAIAFAQAEIGDAPPTLQPQTHTALEEERQVLTKLTIQLPAMSAPPDQVDETKRQLQLQLDNLNQLTAKQWLVNVLLNRMKTTDEIIRSDYGTGTGKGLANKIYELLLKNHQLTQFLLGELKKRMLVLTQDAGGKQHKELIETILKAIHAADEVKDNTFLAFRHNQGVSAMGQLQSAGLEGGMGRQHGSGDEKDFRNDHLSGIALIKQRHPHLESNAITHNPDQCAGGPYQVLWCVAQEETLIAAKKAYETAKKAHENAVWLNGSYARSPLFTMAQELDLDKMNAHAATLPLSEAAFEQATNTYVETLIHHVGNYDVNSLLGKTWMAALRNAHVNRVGFMIDALMGQQGNISDDTMMDVRMDVEVGSPKFVRPPQTAASPSIGTQATLSFAPKPPSKQAVEQKEKEAKKGNAKQRGTQKRSRPQQHTLESLLFAGAQRNPPEEDTHPAKKSLPAETKHDMDEDM